MKARRSILLAAMLGSGAAPIAGGAQSTAPAALEQTCTALAGSVEGDVAITGARVVPAGESPAGPPGAPPTMLPAHCLVEGKINQRTGAEGKPYGIGFELALPLEWNGRFLLMGGGGLNGVIRPPTGPVAAGDKPALARGFAVSSHDSGHKGAGFDRSFYADQRASLDFAEASVRTVTLVARAITEKFYGKAAHHSYMTGCSTGGREGMLASQRYPELFDGIVIGAPAMRPGFSNLGIEYAQVMLNRTLPAGEQGPAGVTPAERTLISAELRRQCDAKDGLADGMIMNVEACRSFDIAALQCRAGQSETCIAPARVEALQLAFTGPKDASGRPIYVPIPWDTGITFTGPGLPGYLPMGSPGVFGPAPTGRDIDIDARVHEILWDAAGRLTDTPYWTNLSTYLGRGAKLLYFHGVSDPWFSAFDTWDYFQRAREANGPEAWDQAARFYMVPGMLHCQGGEAYERFDLLTPLVAWAEQGTAPAPDAILASGPAREGERPMCPHPSYARYVGGDEKSSASYVCTSPESAS